MGFLFSTDVGNIACQASIQALPRHSVSPDSITLSSIYDNEGEQRFDLAHRVITEVSSDYEPVELVPSDPAALKSSVIDVHEDTLGGSRLYKFRDTTYRVSLTDHTMGSHRAELLLRRGDPSQAILSVPVVWQRVPLVSSIPQRVVLGKRPVRVFLRCPDESVELTRVVSSPPGVKAVITSPRELTVQPTDKVPEVLDTVVVVGTTDPVGPLWTFRSCGTSRAHSRLRRPCWALRELRTGPRRQENWIHGHDIIEPPHVHVDRDDLSAKF